MSKHWKGALYPAPVYEATLADGRVVRASFWTKKGKPIDFEAGRRTIAALYARPEKGEPLTAEQQQKRHVEIQAANHRAAAAGIKRDAIKAKHGDSGQLYAHADKLLTKFRAELAFLQGNDPEAAASFFKTYPPAKIICGFVEHPSIGRVADMEETTVRRIKRTVSLDKLRAALEALNLPIDAVLTQLEAA